MRTKFIPPNAAEIATRKRLQLVCEWFNEYAKTVTAKGRGIPRAVRLEIAKQNFEPSDLMAIRQAPHKWTSGDPYTWLWLMHRYQNGE